MTQTPDAAIVARVLAGHRQDFGVLVERYQDRIFGYARFMGFGEAEARDLAQEAFVRAFRYLRRCGDPERFSGWLFRIASNLCRTAGARKALRMMEPLEPYAANLADEALDPEAQTESSRTRERVREALAALPSDQREALVLMYLLGHSVKEIETMTGASASAVKMRLKRGREGLRAQLEPLFAEVVNDD